MSCSLIATFYSCQPYHKVARSTHCRVAKEAQLNRCSPTDKRHPKVGRSKLLRKTRGPLWTSKSRRSRFRASYPRDSPFKRAILRPPAAKEVLRRKEDCHARLSTWTSYPHHLIRSMDRSKRQFHNCRTIWPRQSETKMKACWCTIGIPLQSQGLLHRLILQAQPAQSRLPYLLRGWRPSERSIRSTPLMTTQVAATLIATRMASSNHSERMSFISASSVIAIEMMN